MKVIFRKRYAVLVLLVVLSILHYCTSFFISGVPHYEPEDTFFHFNRLLGLGNVWESPVSFHSFAGTGTYVNLFYPWLTMYPMWALYRLCNSYVLAYKLFYLFLGTITILMSYGCMKSITRDEMSSICFATMYLFSSYRFANVFRRAALGESIAMAVLPLVIMGYYHIFFCDKEK